MGGAWVLQCQKLHTTFISFTGGAGGGEDETTTLTGKLRVDHLSPTLGPVKNVVLERCPDL